MFVKLVTIFLLSICFNPVQDCGMINNLHLISQCLIKPMYFSFYQELTSPEAISSTTFLIIFAKFEYLL